MTAETLEVYLVRHGQSAVNVCQGVIGGRAPLSPLTPRGRAQAVAVGRILRDAGVVPDCVHTSPAVRARDTASLALAQMGLDAEAIVVDERLHEQDVGEWVGLRGEDVFRGEVLRCIETGGKNFRPPGGESMNDVGRRMARWLDGLPDGDSRPSVVVAFTHGGAIRSLASHVHGWSHAKTYGTQPPNASISFATRRGGLARFHYIGRESPEPQGVAEA